MTCGAPHPERPLTCEADGTHADHLAWTPEGFVYWANEDYVAPPPADTRRQRSNARDRFLEAAGRVAPEVRTLTFPFAGETFDPDSDQARLGAQLQRVWSVMRDGQWRTLAEIGAETGDPDASISARLRDFRKSEFGSVQVDRRRRGDEKLGIFEYRVLARPSTS